MPTPDSSLRWALTLCSLPDLTIRRKRRDSTINPWNGFGCQMRIHSVKTSTFLLMSSTPITLLLKILTLIFLIMMSLGSTTKHLIPSTPSKEVKISKTILMKDVIITSPMSASFFSEMISDT